jgi:hypothetical protein
MTQKQFNHVTRFLFILTFILSCLLMNTSFGTIDVARRFEMTEAIWKNQPAISAQDYLNLQFLTGVGGSLHYPYGMGQSIYMLPGDILSSLYLRLVGLPEGSNLHTLLVTLLTFPLFSAGAVTIAFLFLHELKFSSFAAFGGALSLFFGTTLLYYTQFHQENTQILFLTLSGYYQLLLWTKRGRVIHLWLGSSLLGSMLLMRVTTVAEIAGAVFFAFLLIITAQSRTNQIWRQILLLGGLLALTSGFFYFLDRAYQFKRFGSWSGSYIDIWRNQLVTGQSRFNDWGWTVTGEWPYIGDRFGTLLKILFSPAKSLFLYDLLLIVLIGVLFLRRFRLDASGEPRYRSFFLLAALASLLLSILGYSNVEFWHGDWAWAARYFTTPVHLLCLLAVPLLLEFAVKNTSLWNYLLVALCGVALVIQLLSVTLYESVEIIQNLCYGGDLATGADFRLGNRLSNLYVYLTGGRLIPSGCDLLAHTIDGDPEKFVFTPLFPFGFTGVALLFGVGLWLAVSGWSIWRLARLALWLYRQEKAASTSASDGTIGETV